MTNRGKANFDCRPKGIQIDMLVVHYTGMKDAASAISRLSDLSSGVSCHYIIDEYGKTIPLVAEEMRAWHAGVASWRGNRDINARSLGIELVNPGHEFGYRDFPEPQMIAFEKLALDIISRHPIEARNIVGHCDVAPSRKQDPGERFDWQSLASRGIGIWPDGAEPYSADDDEIKSMLANFGYDVDDTTASLKAFQRHFRPRLVDGINDRETAGLLKALVDMLS